MSDETLVLSTSYMPMRRCDWQEAVSLYWCGKVDILESYEDQELHSPSLTLKMPAVIRFRSGVKLRLGQSGVQLNKKNLYVRDSGCCQYCGRRLTLKEASIDHVLPKKYGGELKWDNCVIACTDCNSYKGHKFIYPNHKPHRPTIIEYVRNLVTLKPIPEQWEQYLI